MKHFNDSGAVHGLLICHTIFKISPTHNQENVLKFENHRHKAFYDAPHKVVCTKSGAGI